MQTSHRCQRHQRKHQHHIRLYHDILITRLFASQQSYTSGVPQAPPVGLALGYGSRESPYASTSYRSTLYGSTPYESTPYYTPYYKSAPSGPLTLAASAAPPSGPSAALLSPGLSTIQEETSSVAEMRGLSPAHQKDEPHGSQTQIRRSARAWENYDELIKLMDFPLGFVPIVSPGTGGVRNARRSVDHSNTESRFPTSEQIKEPLVDPRNATADTAMHDEEGGIKASCSR